MSDSGDPRLEMVKTLRAVQNKACDILADYYEAEETIPMSMLRLTRDFIMALTTMIYQYKGIVGDTDPSTVDEIFDAAMTRMRKIFNEGKCRFDDAKVLDTLYSEFHDVQRDLSTQALEAQWSMEAKNDDEKS